jgi:hypothetical protein
MYSMNIAPKFESFRAILTGILLAMGLQQLASLVDPVVNAESSSESEDEGSGTQGSNGWGID